jgi:hypothetical protein
LLLRRACYSRRALVPHAGGPYAPVNSGVEERWACASRTFRDFTS